LRLQLGANGRNARGILRQTGKDRQSILQIRCASVKPYVIFNPSAGSVTDADAVLDELRRLNPTRIRFTQAPGDAEKFARGAARQGHRYIVAAGGDGTLNEVVNGIGLRANRVCLGLVPLGTGNDFAASLGLPSSTARNIGLLLARKTKRIDLVRVKSNRTRYFVNVSAGGFSSIVDGKLTPRIKQHWGSLSYVRSAAAAVPRLHAYRTRLVFDDNEELVIDLYNIVVANGRFVAGGLPIAPQADPADGWLDVILIPKQPAPKMALLAVEIALGRHLSDDAILFRRARKIAVRSRPRMRFNADGELVGNMPAVFQILPHALTFVTRR
jgi:diacylglycerol kinase (ATP)